MLPTIRPVLIYPTPFGTTQDFDVVSFIDAITTSGNSISVQQQNAHHTYAKGLKDDGVWQYIISLDTIAGESLEASRYRLKRPTSLVNTLSYSGFVSEDYSSTLGLLGATNKWIDSGINPVSLGLDVSTLGLWAFNKDSMGSTNKSLIGQQNTFTSPSNQLALGRYSSGSRTGGGINTTFANFTGVTTNRTGLIGVNNENSRLTKFYANGSLDSTASVAGASANMNGTFGYMATKVLDGQALNFYTQRAMLFIITSGLPSSLVVAFNTRTVQFIADMGR